MNDARPISASTSGIKKRFLSGAIVSTIGRASKLGFSLLINVILARLLSPAELGNYYLLISIATFGSLVAVVGMNKIAMKRAAESVVQGDVFEVGVAISSTFIYVVVGSVATLVAYWLSSHKLADLFDSPILFSSCGVILLLITSLSLERYFADVFRGIRKINYAIMYDGALFSVVAFIYFVFAYWLYGALSIGEAILATASMHLIIGLAALLYFVVSGKISLSKYRTDLTAWVVGWKQMLAEIALYMLSEAAIIILGIYESKENVALYSLALRLIMIVRFSQFVVNAVVPPLISELNVSGEKKSLEKLLRAVATLVFYIGLVISAVFFVFGKEIISILFGPEYVHASVVLMILLVGQLANLYVGSCGQLLMMTGNQQALMIISVFVLLFTVVFSALFVGDYGIKGVACVFSGMTIIQSVLTAVSARYFVGIWTFSMLPTRDTIKTGCRLIIK